MEHRLINVFAILVILLIPLITTQVILSALGVSVLISFDREIFLLGSAISQNTLQDLQWAVLATVGLLPAGLVWIMDRHVRVDFIWQRLSSRKKRIVDGIGHLLFSVPFLVMSVPAAWGFMINAFDSRERTYHGGITDVFLIKAMLPIGLVLIGAALLVEFSREFHGKRFKGKSR